MKRLNYVYVISGVTVFVLAVISCPCFAQPAEKTCGTNIIGVCGPNTPKRSIFCDGGFKRGWHFDVSGIQSENASLTSALNSFSSSDTCININKDSLASGQVSLIFTHELCIIEHKGFNCEPHRHVTRIKNTNGYCLTPNSFEKRNHALSYSLCEDFYRSPNPSPTLLLDSAFSLQALVNQRFRRETDASLALKHVLQNAGIGVCGTDNNFANFLICPGGFRRGWHFQVNPKNMQVLPFLINHRFGEYLRSKCVNEDSFLAGKILYIYSHEPCIVEHNGRNCEANKAEATRKKQGIFLIGAFLKGQKSFSICDDFAVAVNITVNPELVTSTSGGGDGSDGDRQIGQSSGGGDGLESSASDDLHFGSGIGIIDDLEKSASDDLHFGSGTEIIDDLESSASGDLHFASGIEPIDDLEIKASGDWDFASGSGSGNHHEISPTTDGQLVSSSSGGDDLEITGSGYHQFGLSSGGVDYLEISGSDEWQFGSGSDADDDYDLDSGSTDAIDESSTSNPETSSGYGFYFYSSNRDGATQKVSANDVIANSSLITVSAGVGPGLPPTPVPMIPADTNQDIKKNKTGGSGFLRPWINPRILIPKLPSFGGGGGGGHDAPRSDPDRPKEDDPKSSKTRSPSTKSPPTTFKSTESTTTQCECTCPSSIQPDQPTTQKPEISTTHAPNSSCPVASQFTLSHHRFKRQIRVSDFDYFMLNMDRNAVMEQLVNEVGNPVRAYYYSLGVYPALHLPRAIVAILRTAASNEEGRSTFTGRDSDRQMEAMHARGYGRDGSRPKDDKGHLVASRFGGPAKLYNMVPQSPLLNRDFQMLGEIDWYRREELVAQWIRNAKCPLVQWSVFIHYAILTTFVPNYRPVGFTLENKFFKPNSANTAYEEIDAMRFTRYYSNRITCQIN